MRSDMKKVLTERPRHWRDLTYRDFRRREARGDLDLLPRHQGMSRPYILNWGHCKQFADLVGPLVRFLHGCVGRRWDDVWSEICACVDSTSVTGRHLRDHVEWEVTRQCRIIGGEVRDISYGGDSHEVTGLYVHPEDGTLRDAGERKRERPDRSRVVLDGVAYSKSDGILVSANGIARKILEHGKREAARIGDVWYWVTFADVAPSFRQGRVNALGDQAVTMIGRICKDIVTGREVREGRYRVGKRQMSARDLLRLGLKNEA
jgi:hypothetical protein